MVPEPAKIVFEKWIKGKARLKIVAGSDNLLDQRYSLGNDINGFGGRYYNAAAGRNYYASLILPVAHEKRKPSGEGGPIRLKLLSLTVYSLHKGRVISQTLDLT